MAKVKPFQPAPEGVKSRVKATAKKVTDIPPSPTDPQGSYTGKPMEMGEKPVQDADDL